MCVLSGRAECGYGCSEAKNDKVKETFVYLYEREKCLFGVILYGQQ